MENKKEDPKFIQISTGNYEYFDKSGNKLVSHSIYGLDMYNKVYKYRESTKEWVLLKEKYKER